MDPAALKELDELSRNHFWFAGARAVFAALIDWRWKPFSSAPRILEAGCGPGGNLGCFRRFGRMTGTDISHAALARATGTGAEGLAQADIMALPFATGAFEIVLLPSLIEHIEDDVGALREAARVCCEGGRVILMTSALQSLWSHHDLANHHFRRYRRKELRERILHSGLALEKISYQNFVTFLPVFLVRRLQRFRRPIPRYDMGRFPGPINFILTLILRLEALCLRRMDFPIGVNLVAVCRKVSCP